MQAFRCKHCGHFVSSHHVGESTMPRACPVCKSGVIWNAGQSTDQPGNWEVLADASPERLAELGLTVEQIEKHTPASREAGIRAGLETVRDGLTYHELRRQHWAANREALVAEFQQFEVRYLELGKQLDAADDSTAIARLSGERDQVYQRLRMLADLEPSPRDGRHEAHLRAKQVEYEAYLAGQAKTRQPQAITLRARDGSVTRDRN